MTTRVMLVDDRRDRARWLKAALDESGYEVVKTVHDMDDLYQLVLDLEPDVVIIEATSGKRDTLEHLGHQHRRYPKPVVMLSEHDDPELLNTAMQAGISAYVVQGLSPQGVRSIINMAITQFNEYQELQHKLARAETRLEDQKLVERAKCMLMEKHQLSEQDAYHLLRKAAMDHSTRITDIARRLLHGKGTG
ncbi:MAG: ANTAR domain-containing protein [Ectothiorhodospiraceae bacterium]|nr:ANTAR domain-containing protein [Ectothiorhodospiraceae bacterium]MCH8505171.1 ANTAR domain-containing protein [Ectothiorhodospiraceae bacterium]